MSGPLGPLLLKSRKGWKVVYSKTFSRATFFVFWGTHLVDRYLSYLLVKQICRKTQCATVMQVNSKLVSLDTALS